VVSTVFGSTGGTLHGKSSACCYEHVAQQRQAAPTFPTVYGRQGRVIALDCVNATKGAGQVGHPTAAVARDRGSLRYGHGTPHNRPREFLCRDRLRKQKALDQIEAHLAHCEKIRPRLNPLSDTTCAIAIGESEDSSAHRPFQSIVRTTGYELSIYFDLRKGKVIETDERWSFCPQIVDCDRDIMEAQLSGDLFQQLNVWNDICAVDLDDESSESWMIGYLPAKTLHRVRILKKCDWKVDCDLHGTLLGDEIAPIINCLRNDKLRQLSEVGITIIWYEICRWHDSPGRMTKANEPLGFLHH
jgi:hypothetical protein